MLDKPVVCPILVGREAYLDVITNFLERARAGHGQTLLVTGEPGIGKSRLLADVKQSAAARSALILQGSCFEPDHSLPYAPIVDLLRALFATSTPLDIARELGPTAPELVKLLPELATALPALAPTPALGSEQEKRRLFHTLSQFLIGLERAQPLMLVIEDLHWSDATSLEFLLYLAHRIAPHAIALLMTYRSDEVSPELHHFLAELDRTRLASELPLACLTINDVNDMLRTIFGLQGPAGAEFVEAIYGLTAGNPFFIEEVLRSLVATGDIFYAEGMWSRKGIDHLRIPRSIQDAVHRRSASLSASSRHLLELAATAGQRFDFALLQAVTEQDASELLRCIKELIAAQLVVEASAEQFAFRHALTRQALYNELLARERTLLHQRVAECIEQVYAAAIDARLRDLAYHFYEGGIWPKALEYSQRAGERAQALYAQRAAAEHFTRALHAADRLAQPPSPRLLRARALAYASLGAFDDARADHEAALEAARATTDRMAEWQALTDLGLLWAGRDYAQTGMYYRRAHQLVGVVEDQRLVAHSLNRLGNWHVNVEEPGEAGRYHQEALSIFVRLDDQRGIAETSDFLGMASYLSGDLVQGTAYYERAVALFRQLDDRERLTSSLATLTLRGSTYQTTTMVLAPGSLADCVRDGELALRIAREIGQRSGEAYALAMLGFCLGAQGEYDRALHMARQGLQLSTEIQHRQWMIAAHCVAGVVFADLFELPAASRHLEQALTLAGETGSLHWTRVASGFLASVYVAQDEPLRAAATLDAALSPDMPARTLGARLVGCARAELALKRGEPDRALMIADDLMASAPNFDPEHGQTILRLSKLRGEALTLLDRPVEAEAALSAARMLAATQGARPMLWRLYAAGGRLHASQARHDQAGDDFAVVQTLVNELAANLREPELRDHYLSNAALAWPRLRPISAARAQSDGLTAREREIATAVAQGNSNREIADKLVLSERTVESHVGNILAKLGFRSRTQIAGWAIEKGWLPTRSSS